MCRLLTYRTIWLIHLKNNSNENRKRWNFIKNWTFDVLEVFRSILAFFRIIQAFPYFIWTNFYIVFICGMIQLCVYSLPYKPFACTIKLLKKSFREIYQWSVNKHIGKIMSYGKKQDGKTEKIMLSHDNDTKHEVLDPPWLLQLYYLLKQWH